MFWPSFAHCGDDLASNPGSVFEWAAIFVFPEIAERREKFMGEIPVSGMNLEDQEASLPRAARCLPKCVDDPANPVFREFFGHWVLIRIRNRGRREWHPAAVFDGDFARALPRALCAALAPGVSDLHPGHGSLVLHESNNAR